MAAFKPGQSPPPVSSAIFRMGVVAVTLFVLYCKCLHRTENPHLLVVNIDKRIRLELLPSIEQMGKADIVTQTSGFHLTQVIEILDHGPARPDDLRLLRHLRARNKCRLGSFEDLETGTADNAVNHR